MEEVWRGPLWTLPFLLLGSTRRILLPNCGRSVPFTIANYAYVDRYGRETVTWSRRFRFPRHYRTFDATMIYSKRRDKIVDYLGTHQHLAVDLDATSMGQAPCASVVVNSASTRAGRRSAFRCSSPAPPT